ncbi:unnamed protein product [Dovyalis caffra]|uniref:Uncharacterized protein n=1 Tax=Dovyalis caffra TaxID=77055 RepID=A0AAV1RCM9_9ROSI|nr:unnamed protein product [Dovyalis caffra]
MVRAKMIARWVALIAPIILVYIPGGTTMSLPNVRRERGLAKVRHSFIAMRFFGQLETHRQDNPDSTSDLDWECEGKGNDIHGLSKLVHIATTISRQQDIDFSAELGLLSRTEGGSEVSNRPDNFLNKTRGHNVNLREIWERINLVSSLVPWSMNETPMFLKLNGLTMRHSCKIFLISLLVSKESLKRKELLQSSPIHCLPIVKVYPFESIAHRPMARTKSSK